MTADSEEKTALYSALGRLPSGIYILTIGAGDDSTGMLVSWVQQAGFDPPMVSLAIKRGRPVSDRVESGEPFALNIVGEGQTQFLKHFGKGFEPGEPAFEGVALASDESGVPVLADALATLHCRATSGVDAGDHRVVVAEVRAAQPSNDIAPMVHIRKRGDHY